VSDFSDLILRAVNPDMELSAREDVYRTVRAAIRRLHERANLDPLDLDARLQQHAVEETIRDVETRIMRYRAQRQLEEAQAAQRRG
jgi:hypothetical protein